jgi:hypothetical protein
MNKCRAWLEMSRSIKVRICNVNDTKTDTLNNASDSTQPKALKLLAPAEGFEPPT